MLNSLYTIIEIGKVVSLFAWHHLTCVFVSKMRSLSPISTSFTLTCTLFTMRLKSAVDAGKMNCWTEHRKHSHCSARPPPWIREALIDILPNAGTIVLVLIYILKRALWSSYLRRTAFYSDFDDIIKLAMTLSYRVKCVLNESLYHGFRAQISNAWNFKHFYQIPLNLLILLIRLVITNRHYDLIAIMNWTRRRSIRNVKYLWRHVNNIIYICVQ